MARNKAIFDADILINMVKTGSLDYLTGIFDQIYISDYVWKQEIKNETEEYKVIKKLMNKRFIVILDYEKLTPKQRKFYLNAYDILKNRALSDFVNEGERITAAFAKAHSIPYYMSDDNKAAPYIKSLSVVEVINYCDLLYIAYVIRSEEIKRLSGFYSEYLSVFEDGLPKTVKDKTGKVLDFIGIIAKCYDKFKKSQELTGLLKLLRDKP
ncbi:MAG: hypothetical protein PHQ15_11830 [Methanosarcina sp.]|nr:hypothetical protein [Methanosarcina sp.]